MKNVCKRVLTTLLVALLLVSFAVPSAMALEPTDIFSNEALVVDKNTDTILYSKDTTPGSVEIASLTKIMTYVLAAENIEDLSVQIKVPTGTQQKIIEQDASNASLEDEYEYTALDLLYGLMLPSGCDAADVLAEYVSATVGKDFVEMMNEKALELGIAKRITMSAMYMDSFQLDTDHPIYDDSLYPEKPELTVAGTYVYNGQEQIAEVGGYDPQTMQITGTTATNAGTYTIAVTPNVRWKDFSTDPVTVTWTIEKADPQVTLPVLVAKSGTSLKDIVLPEHFTWENPDATVDPQTRFSVIYTPEDTDNYNVLVLELEIELIPEIEDEEDMQDPTTPSEPDDNTNGSPNTSDSFALGLYATMAVASLVGLVALTKKSRG